MLYRAVAAFVSSAWQWCQYQRPALLGRLARGALRHRVGADPTKVVTPLNVL